MKSFTARDLTEDVFEKTLPEHLQQKSRRFFTPAEIAIQAAKWLSGNDERRVLDIGAGVGKFCLFGAHYTNSRFVGIEMRPGLVKIANQMFRHFGTSRAEIIHRNVLDFPFTGFDAFYFYNPFQENISQYIRLDDSAHLAREFYYEYTQYTNIQLNLAPKNSRLVTFHGNNYDAPEGYKCIRSFRGDLLKFWVKQE